jgi:hypothetical protein
MSHTWDVDQYCHHEGWKRVMTSWKDQQINATVRKFQEFASALSTMDLSLFEPKVDAEASDKSCRIAHDAATSRLCPVQDAIDYWNSGSSQVEAVTDQGGSALGQDGHNVDA